MCVCDTRAWHEARVYHKGEETYNEESAEELLPVENKMAPGR